MSDESNEITPAPDRFQPARDEIDYWEKRLEAIHGEFSWDIHNELRHHYLWIDARKSRYHADVILQSYIMDSYTLNTLSNWHFPGRPEQGIRDLEHLLMLYPDLLHLQAACLIHLGDAYLKQGMLSSATKSYQRAAEIDVPTVAPYRELAEKRLNS